MAKRATNEDNIEKLLAETNDLYTGKLKYPGGRRIPVPLPLRVRLLRMHLHPRRWVSMATKSAACSQALLKYSSSCILALSRKA
jgi:hypothetical protein